LVSGRVFDPAKREKVKRYYHGLEEGLLEPGRVERRVFDVLAEALHGSLDDLRGWRPLPPATDVFIDVTTWVLRRLHRPRPSTSPMRSAMKSTSFSWTAGTARKSYPSRTIGLCDSTLAMAD
jgi:hypothetical protein